MSYLVYLFYRLAHFAISIIPMKILYGMSSMLYFVLYHIIGYRKKVARSNLEKCFPDWKEEKTDRELKIFYKYFCDLLVESLKGGSASIKHLEKQFELGDQTLIQNLKEEGKSAIILMGHYSNWESAAIRYGVFSPIKIVAIFKALKNKRINSHIKKTRGRTGLEFWSIEKFKKERKKVFNEPCLLVLIADQSPSHVDTAYWIPFFGNILPWYQGPENMAINHKVPVLFANIEYNSRGKYTVHFEPIDYDPNIKGDLTKKFVAKLEKQIRDAPNYWLWTHKRWKRAHLFDPEKHVITK